MNSFGQAALLKEEVRGMKTYPFFDPNRVPSLAINNTVSRFYPYFMFDGYTAKGAKKDWKIIRLENDFIHVEIAPEVGGKVLGATDKTTGKEFVYNNKVMKFRAIGIRGPWTSGGIEHNFGLDLGHAPWAASPVDYVLQNNADGSVSCIVGGLDLASRTEWRVNIRLPKDKAYFLTESLWFNPSPLHHAYLSWENAAYKATDDLEFYFPGTHHIGHDGSASSWPIDDQGRNLAMYKENNFGGSKSYHVVGTLPNWFGGYWHKTDFGFGHWAPFSDAPGKKLWIWSLARDGAIWEDLLTDTDGQYIEAQSGVKLNQAGERSGYHSPYRQLSFRPLYTETKTDAWFPVKEIKGMVDAALYGSLNISRGKDSLKVGISPNAFINDSLIITVNDSRVYSELVSLMPLQTFVKALAPIQDNNDVIKVYLGKNKMIYSSAPQHNLVDRPVRTSEAVQDDQSAERFFRLGEEENAMRSYRTAMKYYQDCIKKEPSHSEALARIAELHYRRGEYSKGLEYARQVLEFNSYHGAANFIYGVLQKQNGDLVKAEEAFSIAARTMEYRSSSYVHIASIHLKKGDYPNTLIYAKKALEYNANNLTAYELIETAYRKLQNTVAAQAVLEQHLKIDPLSHYAQFEKFLLHPTPDNLSKFTSRITNELPYETFLELALKYASNNLNEEAIRVLEQAPSYPMVHYWLAYLLKDVSKVKSQQYLNLAIGSSPEMVFPFRFESIPVLSWAKEIHPSWKTKYYLGLIYWNMQRQPEAKSLFEQCGDLPDYAPFYLARNVLLQDDSSKRGSQGADIKRAIALDRKEWRSWHDLTEYYQKHNENEKEVDNARQAYALFPGNPVIGMDYAKALLNNQQFHKTLDVLNKVNILPQEGAQEGHEVYEAAHLELALQKIKQKKYNDAIQHLNLSLNWPEHLGAGKPFHPDIRLQEYLIALCFDQLRNQKQAASYYDRIKEYSLLSDSWGTTHNAVNHYIGTVVLEKNGMKQEALGLLDQLKNKQDSLFRWGIMAGSSSIGFRWLMAKVNNQKEDLLRIEKVIVEGQKEKKLRLFIRAMELLRVEDRKTLAQSGKL